MQGQILWLIRSQDVIEHSDRRHDANIVPPLAPCRADTASNPRRNPAPRAMNEDDSSTEEGPVSVAPTPGPSGCIVAGQTPYGLNWSWVPSNVLTMETINPSSVM